MCSTTRTQTCSGALCDTAHSVSAVCH